jgi:hypothetical protein
MLEKGKDEPWGSFSALLLHGVMHGDLGTLIEEAPALAKLSGTIMTRRKIVTEDYY